MSGCSFAGAGDHFIRPGRNYPPPSIRPPDKGGIPGVAAISGFGTGGGAGITQASGISDAAKGHVAIRVGANPAAAGTLSLNFPAPYAASYWVGAEWAALVPTQGNPLAIAWTATRPLVPGELVLLAYEASPLD